MRHIAVVAVSPSRALSIPPTWRDRASMQAMLAADLPYAIEHGQLTVFYQPLLHLPSRTITGFEALLRWQHPEIGLVPPNHFIPLAEETGWIIPLGEWVLRQSAYQIRDWQQRFSHLPRLTMNVNVSPKQLRPELVATVENVLAEAGIAPEALGLELTESTLVPEIDSARQTLARLQALRVGLRLDDFGVGYSSLSYLQTLRFDTLKIDRSFVERVATDEATRAIVETVIELARKLRMNILAEGIEREEQAQRLIELGCAFGQGFLFSKPVPAESIEAMLAAAPATRDLRALGSMLETCGEAGKNSRRIPETSPVPCLPNSTLSLVSPGACLSTMSS